METEIVKYDITDAAIAKMKDLYMCLTITDLKDEGEFAAVHDARIVVKNHRVAVEKKRTKLKADSLAWGRKVDGEAKRIRELLETIENHLQTEEKKVTDEQKRIKEEADRKEREKIDSRLSELAKYNYIVPFMEVATLLDDEYDVLLAKMKGNYEFEQKRLADEEATRKVESERLEKVAKEQAVEAKRLADIQKEIDAKKQALKNEKDKIEAQKRVGIEQKRNFREEVLRSIGIYRAGMAGESLTSRSEGFEYAGSAFTWNSIIDMLDVDFDKFLKDIKAQLNNFEIAKKEEIRKRVEQERADAKIKAEKEAEEKIRQEAREKIEKEKAELEEKARLLELAPDKDRLIMFADKIHDFTIDELNVKSQEARVIYGETIGAILAVEATLRAEIKEL